MPMPRNVLSLISDMAYAVDPKAAIKVPHHQAPAELSGRGQLLCLIGVAVAASESVTGPKVATMNIRGAAITVPYTN